MLRSAGYFAGLPCPFTLGPASCQRPHCQYSHGQEEAVGGEGSAEPGAAEMGKSMKELERINKAIEEVKTEVEENRKKLSLYEHVAQNESPTTASEPVDLNDNDPSCSSRSEHAAVEDQQVIVSASNQRSKPYNSMSNKKYVIDRRCPATDLEYDPLLNYSAGLLCSSSVKESDHNGSKLKRSKTCTMESSEESPNKRSKVSSPIRLEIQLQDSDDDLIIDVPPLQPVIKKPRALKKSPRDCNSEINGCLNMPEDSTNDKTKISVEVVGNESSQIVPNTVIDGTQQSETSNTDGEQFTQLVNSSDILKSSLVKQVKHDKDTVHVAEENAIGSPTSVVKVVQNEASMEDESKNDKLCQQSEPFIQKEEIKHTLKSSELAKENSIQELCKEKPVLVLETSKQDLAQVTVFKKNRGTVFGNKVSSETSVSSDQPIFIDCSTSQQEALKTGYCKENVKESEIIVLGSSSEESDTCEENIDFSDSEDPMEECLRIFNEFAESESQKEPSTDQVLVEDNSEVDASDPKSTDMVHGQKKRIAHPSRIDVKSNNEVCVPLREPAPQPMPRARILQVQQQAVQITAAVKSGRAFVAAATSQHTIKSGLPTQVRRIGKIVYVNLLDVQPTVPYRIPRHGVLQRNSLAAVPSKSNVPLKKIQPSAKVSVRRRPSIVPDSGSKVPHDMRQRYVNFFVEEYLKVCSTVNDAFDKALSEEKAIYDRCGSKNMYLNISVNTLKKLRDHGTLSSSSISPSGSKDTNAIGSRKKEKNVLTGVILYRLLTDYLMNEEQLKENGYPLPNPDKPGSAILHNGLTKNLLIDALRRVCCRCGETYAVTSQGKHVRKEECTYHSGKVLRHRVPGGLETRYSCCEAVVGTPGCQVTKFHVHDGQKDNLDGFVKTFKKPPQEDGNYGVFAVDCEVCYTTQGLNLTRVTVVDPGLQVVYDTFVKPDNEIIDYNTRFSGVTEDDLKNVTTTIRDVQAILLNLFSAETIVIGHSLENDLFALKLFHDNVVDTSIVFPHRLGFPHKEALRDLMAEYLQRLIQDDVGGHDSREDASACMELLIWKVKEDTKGRRW